MKEWLNRFIEEHGDRIFYLIMALTMASTFMGFEDLKESGKTILIGVAMLAYNKARTPKDKK